MAAWVIESTMGGFYGYTPADAAEDLKTAEGLVLLKPEDKTEVRDNKTYIRANQERNYVCLPGENQA